MITPWMIVLLTTAVVLAIWLCVKCEEVACLKKENECLIENRDDWREAYEELKKKLRRVLEDS